MIVSSSVRKWQECRQWTGPAHCSTNFLGPSVNPGQLHYLHSGQPAGLYRPPPCCPLPSTPPDDHHDKYTQTIVVHINQSPVGAWLSPLDFICILGNISLFLTMTVEKPNNERLDDVILLSVRLSSR